MTSVQTRETAAHHQRRDVGRQIARVDPSEDLGDRAEACHRQRRPGGRQDRRLGRRRGRGQHRDDQDLVERRAEHRPAERAEDVIAVVLQEGGAGVGLGRCGHDHVDQHEQDRAHDRGPPWPVGAVLGFLVDADAAVPAPVDEHPQEDAVDQRGGAAVEGEGVEPVRLDVEAARIAEVHLGEGDRREQAERRDLRGEQEVLGARRELDADVADRRSSR